jgi:molybdopterin-binding protein
MSTGPPISPPARPIVVRGGLACCAVLMSKTFTMGEAAQALGVSVDTLRRWDRAGKITTSRDRRNQRLVAQSEIDRLSDAPRRHQTESSLSARNRFPGIVRSVEVSGVMALVEIEAGPHRITAAITRDSIEELGLREGMPATARVKATSVMIERSV